MAGAASLLLALASYSAAAEPAALDAAPPAIQAGILDLRHYDFRRSGPIDLSGAWEFRWLELATPGAVAARAAAEPPAFLNIPSSWNDQTWRDQTLPGMGYGSYHLRVLLPAASERRAGLALYLPAASASLRVLVNERLIYEQGRVASEAAAESPDFRPGLTALDDLPAEFFLTLQVSNFTHSQGGLWSPPRLGLEGDLRAERRRAYGTDLFLWGALFIMGAYHLILFALRPADRSPLYFGLLCLLVVVRVLVTGDRWLPRAFPEIPFGAYYRLEYLSFYLGVPAFGWFIRSAFPLDMPRLLARITLAVGLAFSAVVVLTPPALFSLTLLPYQLYTVLAGAGALFIGILAWSRRRQGAALFVIGWLVFFAAVVHDILGANLIIQAPYLTPFALFLFFFAQAAMLALRFTDAYRRSAELSDRLGKTERLYRQMIEEAAEGVFLLERSGVVVTVNRALARLLGYDSAETLQREAGDARRGVFASDAEWERFAASLAPGGVDANVRDFETHFVMRSGGALAVAINAQAIADLNSGVVRYQGMVRDITEQRRLEEMRVARDAAEAASRSKSQFLANMSHEIRTPMNAILGMADLLAEAPEAREQKKYLTTLQGAGETLLALINDILDLAKVEAGRIELESVRFDLSELVESTVEIMANAAHKKGLEISYRVDPDSGRFAISDPTRLRQILVNLIGNAIKFTESGSVTIEVFPARPRSAENADGIREILFRIVDTGIGIPLEKQEVIFDAFSQADNSTTREFGGTGLGLTISKRLAELMSGTIKVDSAPGKGSVFTLHIPVLQGATVDAAEPGEIPNLIGRRILVVDDVALNRTTFRETLETCGARVTVAESGAAALDALQRAAGASDAYEVVLLDYHMPNMDGLETARRVRAAQDYGTVPIIAISSDHLPETAASFHALGVKSHLSKPVRRAALLAAVAEAVGLRGARAEGASETNRGRENAPSGAASAVRPMRVLLVEDNEDNRTLIQAFLRDSGVHLEQAVNGAEAVRLFQNFPYDLILMDMHMPVMDGYAATRAIRLLEQGSAQAAAEAEGGRSARNSTPILALTAHAMREEIAEILAAGCDAHLAKPVKKSKLLEAIALYGKREDGTLIDSPVAESPRPAASFVNGQTN